MKRAIAAVCGVALLSACTVGPDYHLPAAAKFNAPAARGGFVALSAQGGVVELPAHGVASLSAQPSVATAAPVPAQWWHLFDSPRLDALETEGLAANTSLRVAAANLARANAIVTEIRGARDVQGDASFAAERAQLSGESYLLPVQLPSSWLGDGEAHMSYQLDIFGRLKRAAEAAGDDREAAQDGLALARVTLAADIARAYVEACAAGYQLAAASRQEAVLEHAESVTRQLSQAGRIAPIAVAQAAAQAAQARASLPPLRAAGRAALYRLATLTGHPPADYPRDLEGCAALPRLARPLPVGDGAALLRRRPDIAAAERHLAAATARIGVATAALYPDISLGADVGSIGKLAELGLPAAQTWAAGSLISWTFPTRGERARVDAASAEAAAALAQFDQTVLTALRETETSLTAYGHDVQRNLALRAARDNAAQAAQESRALVEAGRSAVLNGLAVKQAAAAADVALAVSDAQLAQDQVNLFLALGGGWAQR